MDAVEPSQRRASSHAASLRVRHIVETEVPSTAPPRLQDQRKPSTTCDESEPLPIPSDDIEAFQLQPFVIKFATISTGGKPSTEGQVTILPSWDYDYGPAMLMKKAAKDLCDDPSCPDNISPVDFSMTMGYRLIQGREKYAVARLRSAADLEDLKDQVNDLQERYSSKNKNWSVSISLQAKYVPPDSSGSSDGELDNPARTLGGRKRPKKHRNNPSKRLLNEVKQHSENYAFKFAILFNVTKLQDKWVCEEHEGRWGQFMALPDTAVDELTPPHTPTFGKFHRVIVHAPQQAPRLTDHPRALRMEDAEYVAGFMSFVAKNNPSYTGFNAAQTEQAFRENGLALEDLKRVPAALLAPLKGKEEDQAPTRGPTAVYGFRLIMFQAFPQSCATLLESPIGVRAFLRTYKLSQHSS
ncbi:hypothetical protein G7K_4923-t1 [Saitoella complicata NRRL Y-17804]|uniref:Uncharacterized protein n=1 Tax=Saitoella complicata (strain BCRC 22490 / CBS 7301 / JCM 7358 / NBRC 10748 / NRRL Y-17804) TaxID=698492 RepID=A0A0E9NLP3_SAICN|nr:hypothetical protein G7K_4923-t1 [Saitoella complicata NRRL Y-17804]